MDTASRYGILESIGGRSSMNGRTLFRSGGPERVPPRHREKLYNLLLGQVSLTVDLFAVRDSEPFFCVEYQRLCGREKK